MTMLILISPSPLERRRYFGFICKAPGIKVADLFFERSVLRWRSISSDSAKERLIVVVNGNRLPDRVLVRVSMLLRFDILVLQHGANLSTPMSKKSLSKIRKQFPKYVRWIFGTFLVMLWLTVLVFRCAFLRSPEWRHAKRRFTILAYTKEYLTYWQDRIPSASGKLLPVPNPRTYGAIKDGVNVVAGYHGDLAMFVDELYEETYGLNHEVIWTAAVEHATGLNLELVLKLHPRAPPDKYAALLNKQALVHAVPENLSVIYGYESSLLKLIRCDAKFKWDPGSQEFKPYRYDAALPEGDYESSVLECLSAI